MTQLEKQRQQPPATAVGAKTARPCDSCLHSRSRWYCAADDAFLCQNCDSSIHSANALARRHERLRLKVSSSSFSNIKHHHVVVDNEDDGGGGKPTWHRGFKRKARTPRGGGKESRKSSGTRIGAVVPELGTSSSSDVEECAVVVDEEEAGQLLYRVPVFDPVLTKFQSASSNAEMKKSDVIITPKKDQSFHGWETIDGFPAFLRTEMDLGEFEIDMESLLGIEADEKPFSMEGLGLMDSPEEVGSSGVEKLSPTENYGTVKEEEQEEKLTDDDLTDVKFDCGSPWTGEEKTGEEKTDEDKKVIGVAVVAEGKKAKIMLRLNYDAVITEWSSQGSPWTNGQKPMLDSDDSFPDIMGMVYVGGGEFQCGMSGNNGGSGLVTASAGGDGGREARVSRYREKRRTRLFSKKIRYEVRKLNAEKRPRMKGRFVKRISSATSTTTSNVAARANAVASLQFA